ncbi:hypothetical protein LMG28138_04950 [Pararobbsia alpina]|uniref:Uncharacterized protein n=1 Tax=Pararobbsia alpina TaxID=621374 RepID=A0A6S7CYH3_9BURK|nr:hypothetical protein LMG28138_04950 [Pararobbsia alpina]
MVRPPPCRLELLEFCSQRGRVAVLTAAAAAATSAVCEATLVSSKTDLVAERLTILLVIVMPPTECVSSDPSSQKDDCRSANARPSGRQFPPELLCIEPGFSLLFDRVSMRRQSIINSTGPMYCLSRRNSMRQATLMSAGVSTVARNGRSRFEAATRVGDQRTWSSSYSTRTASTLEAPPDRLPPLAQVGFPGMTVLVPSTLRSPAGSSRSTDFNPPSL